MKTLCPVSPQKKCERYWGHKDEEPFVCEPFSVYCVSSFI